MISCSNENQTITIVVNQKGLGGCRDLLNLAESYDHYTGAIDDGTQYRDANEKNKSILEDLKNGGVLTVTWHNHQEMFSSTIKDKIFNLEED
jgi:hypothetical protein